MNIRPINAYITPEQLFGAKGDGSDDAAALNSFMAALVTKANATGRAFGFLSQLYSVQSQVLLDLRSCTGKVLIEFGAGAGFKPTGSATFRPFNVIGGQLSGSTNTVQNTFLKGADTTILDDVSQYVDGGFCVLDQLISILAPNAHQQQLMRIAHVDTAAKTLMFDVPLGTDFYQANTFTCQPFTMGTGSLETRGTIFIDGSSYTGSGSFGLALSGLNEPRIDSIRTYKMNSTNSQGVTISGVWRGAIGPIMDEGSGYIGVSNAIDLLLCTATQFPTIGSGSTSGFGVVLENCHWCQFGSVQSLLSGGRGVKLAQSCSNQFANVEASQTQISYAGLALTYASSYNQFANVTTENNAQYGVWTDSRGNLSNTIDILASTNNGAHDVFIAGDLDQFNAFLGIVRCNDFNVSSPATKTVARWARPSHVVAKPLSAGQSIANNSKTLITLDNELIDMHDEFASNTFTVKIPGYYRFEARATGQSALGTLNELYLSVGGTASQPTDYAVSTSATTQMRFERTFYLMPGDNITMSLQQNSGGAVLLQNTDMQTSLVATQV